MSLAHFVLPHPYTHRKAHLLSAKAISVYIVLFLGLQLVFRYVGTAHPDVLGISADLAVPDLINLTNQERAKNGLPALKENSQLDAAALAKAQNMFAENYWAHYSPSGKDPWGFILAAGYKFSYAGENLARNFYSSQDVVDAWMNSPSHKANMVNTHYQDIGMAVEEGTLLGQPTILVVQEFGAPPGALAAVPAAPTAVAPAPAANSNTLSVNTGGFRIDPYQTVRYVGFGLIALLGGLLILDYLVLRRRGVYATSGRHLPHLAILSVAVVALFTLSPGGII